MAEKYEKKIVQPLLEERNKIL